MKQAWLWVAAAVGAAYWWASHKAETASEAAAENAEEAGEELGTIEDYWADGSPPDWFDWFDPEPAATGGGGGGGGGGGWGALDGEGNPVLADSGDGFVIGPV